jgi:hypothetical protein
LAILALVLLVVFSQGVRGRVMFAAICGAVITGFLTVIGSALFGGLQKVGSALLSAFT